MGSKQTQETSKIRKVTYNTAAGHIVEYTKADDAAIRIRCLALNWQLISIEIEGSK